MENRIREYRLKLGWTQTELAEELGISQSAVSQLELGTMGTYDKVTRDLCRLVGALEEELFPPETPRPPCEPKEGILHVVAFLDPHHEEAQAWYEEFGEEWQELYGVTIYPSFEKVLETRTRLLEASESPLLEKRKRTVAASKAAKWRKRTARMVKAQRRRLETRGKP